MSEENNNEVLSRLETLEAAYANFEEKLSSLETDLDEQNKQVKNLKSIMPGHIAQKLERSHRDFKQQLSKLKESPRKSPRKVSSRSPRKSQTRSPAKRSTPRKRVGRPPKATVEEEEDEEEYEVERIVESRLMKGKRHFLVYWKGYSEEDASWEPEENLENAKEKIQEYEQTL